MILKSVLVSLLLFQSLDDLFKSANADLDAQRFAEAIAKYEQILKEEPDHVPTLFNMAASHHGLGEKEEAIEWYKRALSLDDKLYEARVNLGLLLQESGDLDGAAVQFEAIVASEPDNPGARLKVALLYLTGKQVERAYPHLLFAAEQGPPSLDVYLALSEVEFNRGNEPKSLEYLERASLIDATNPKIQRQLGIMYFAGKHYEKAVRVLERNVEIEPENSDDWFMLAKSYFEIRRFPEAVNASLRFLTLKPDSSDGYWTLGFAFYAQEDWKRASLALLRYVELRPNQPIAHFVLATAFDKLDNSSEALVHYNRFLELDDKSSDVRSFQARERAKALERRSRQ